MAELAPVFPGNIEVLPRRYPVKCACISIISELSEAALKRYQLTPRARIHHISVSGDCPIWHLRAPIPATANALRKAGMSIEDIDFAEVNEAFASVVMAWQHETGMAMDRINVGGGAIGLGHPLGASGVRLTTRLLHTLEQHQARFGLQTMCEGGGQANVTIIERLG